VLQLADAGASFVERAKALIDIEQESR